LLHVLSCEAESHKEERMAAEFSNTFFSGAEVVLPDTEVDRVADAMIEA
jgi:hypothetical protein